LFNLSFHLRPADRLLPFPALIQPLCADVRTRLAGRLAGHKLLFATLANLDNPHITTHKVGFDLKILENLALDTIYNRLIFS
jgi:hypothetical protein